ncbi:penicillin acylase family protein [Aquimonas voraii]|uniref:Penicillin amidase n=1 Tax=Aquimonas voraii TaxID=265719 RepID=A0A1G6SUF6_9GAMM|nr:penicillin acylase family protein [Aquimonas voraii]SDD20463.1 penicillin amidase [Aquimonas voraii]
MPSRSRRPRLLRYTVRTLAAFGLLLALALIGAWLLLRASLPQLAGEGRIAGLSAPVQVERDALGVVTLRAESRSDALRALGFVHAQERYFEMDLARRSAAGELAALVGAVALPRDRAHRTHRLRARVRAEIERAPADQREQLQAYVEGVNAGLAALGSRPWAYWLLRVQPEPWREEDSLLAGLAMFFDLQDSQNRRELGLLQLRAHQPDALVDLVAAPGSAHDAPLFGEALPSISPTALLAALWSGATAPQATESDQEAAASDEASSPTDPEPPSPGSNNFAVAGALTADGRALVADDMHLGLRAPGVWFRVRLVYPDPEAPGGQVDATGVSLPGVPALVVGSTGHVAWGFTNSYGDWHDWVQVDFTDTSRTRYRTPEGEETLTLHREVLAVRGGEPETLETRETRWGPLLATAPDGTELALRWTAHRPGAIDLGMADLLRAADLEQALAVAQRSGTPVQNFVAGDRSGRIGWTLMGRIPQRLGDCDPLRPLRPLDGCDWAEDWLSPEAAPRLLDPDTHRLWTANSRVVDLATLRTVGDGGYDLGARPAQIRDQLMSKQHFTEEDLLAVQLDDRALFLQGWWQRLRVQLEAAPSAPELAALEAATRERPERASITSVSYRASRSFRTLLVEAFSERLFAPARDALGEDFAEPKLSQLEAVLQAYLALPADALPPDWPTPAQLQRDAALELAGEWASQGGDLGERTWGERNTSAICHPLAGALGPARNLLCMPGEPLPGDNHMPRVQGPSFGASQRMVVSPGREAEGIFHMPAGQSGHPLSPFWRAGHDDWSAGRPSDFLPGAAIHLLTLQP